METKIHKDYFGSEIHVGDRGIRVDQNSVTHAPFKKFTLSEIDNDMYSPIRILLDGAS